MGTIPKNGEMNLRFEARFVVDVHAHITTLYKPKEKSIISLARAKVREEVPTSLRILVYSL